MRQSLRLDVATTPTRSIMCWPFPGVFRGLLDGGIRHINDEMLSAAANAIANQVASGSAESQLHHPQRFRCLGVPRGCCCRTPDRRAKLGLSPLETCAHVACGRTTLSVCPNVLNGRTRCSSFVFCMKSFPR